MLFNFALAWVSIIFTPDHVGSIGWFVNMMIFHNFSDIGAIVAYTL